MIRPSHTDLVPLASWGAGCPVQACLETMTRADRRPGSFVISPVVRSAWSSDGNRHDELLCNIHQPILTFCHFSDLLKRRFAKRRRRVKAKAEGFGRRQMKLEV